MTQFPLPVFIHPDMGRAEPVRETVEISPVHDRLLEHFRGLWELVRGNAEVPEDFLREPLWKFTIVAAHQRHAFRALDIARADFLRRVVSCAANAELDEGGVVVKVIDAVIDRIVLRVGARRALRRSLKAAVFDGIIVARLRMPLQLISEIVHFSLGLPQAFRIRREVRQQVLLLEAVIGLQFGNGGPAQVDV